MTVRGKVGMYVYVSESTRKDVDAYLEKHYHTKMAKSSFIEEAIKAQLRNNHTHIDPYLKSGSKIKQITEAIIASEFVTEIPLEKLREIIVKNLGWGDERTIEKYMGKWTKIRIPDPDDRSKILQRYERHIQVRKKKGDKTGLLFEIGLLNEVPSENFRGIFNLRLNWEVVDQSWWPKEILEGPKNES